MNPLKKILVVEDDPVLRMTTQKQLSILGYAAEAVGTGEDAVGRDRADLHLILMDVGLPGIDGITAAMMIREDELKSAHKRVPIIALTAHSDRQRCILAGMDDFIQKPALLNDLKEMIKKWLA